MLMKICSHCGRQYPADGKCTCQSVRDRNREYDRHHRNKRSRYIYHTREWNHLSHLVRKHAMGRDEYVYATEGITIPGNTVHHIIPLRDDITKAFDINNLICLSSNTHDKAVKREYEASVARKKKMQAVMLRIAREREERQG